MSKVISAEVPDELADRIDAARAGEPPDYDESRSATVKRLIKQGLDAEEAEPGMTGPRFITYLLGWVLVAGAFLTVEQFLGYIGIALVLGNILDHRYGFTR